MTITLKTSSGTAGGEADLRPPGWLLFILTLQGQQAAVRMRVWRALKALGTAVLRDGVYLLPNRAKFVESLKAQSDDVTASGGSAQILEFNARDERQELAFRRLFDRTQEYEKLMLEIAAARKELRRAEAATLSARLTRLRRDYETVVMWDFFPGAACDQARDALDDLSSSANAVLSPGEPHAASGAIRLVDPTKYKARSWATRARPWADRLASAWLIRRFIDRRAKFVWLKEPNDCPKRAVGFDFDGAEFTHVGTRVTFEVLLDSFALRRDVALERIGSLIHYLDVGGVPVAEAAGVEALLRGLSALHEDDDRLTVEASKLFDFLYASYAATAS